METLCAQTHRRMETLCAEPHYEELLQDSRDSADPRYGIAPCRSTDQPGLSFCAESGFDKLARLSVHEIGVIDHRS